MGKTYIDTVKYLIYTDVYVDGLVKKPDMVGAIFGQTEGLLGGELDLRDLQKNGRIGRIEVNLNRKKGETKGTIKIPSSLDMVETSIIAAALETVDRVGPCEAKLDIKNIQDTRSLKRRKVVDRAKELLQNLLDDEIPESQELSKTVREEVKTAEVIKYGADNLAAGPGVKRSGEVVLVEGRADVINLLKNDVRTVLSIGGAKVTQTIVDVSKEKEVTLFLDGDRGGDIILNELSQGGVDIDFVARAPKGKEVEELTRKELIKKLRNKVPYEQKKKKKKKKSKRKGKGKKKKKKKSKRKGKGKKKKKKKSKKRSKSKRNKDIKYKEELLGELEELQDSLRARFYNENLDKVEEVPVREVITRLGEENNISAIVFDGIITQRLTDLASKQGVKTLVGLKKGNVKKIPDKIEIITKE